MSFEALTLYLAVAAASWLPPRSVDENGAQLQVAAAVARVSIDEKEPPLPGKTRAETALRLYAIAFEESGAVWARVVRGDCRGMCDGGHAYSPWQIHAEQGGIVLDGLSFRYASAFSPAWRAANAPSIVTGARLEESLDVAARVAIHMMRRSVRIWTRGPQAEARAARYFRARPYQGVDVLAASP